MGRSTDFLLPLPVFKQFADWYAAYIPVPVASVLIWQYSQLVAPIIVKRKNVRGFPVRPPHISAFFGHIRRVGNPRFVVSVPRPCS